MSGRRTLGAAVAVVALATIAGARAAEPDPGAVEACGGPCGEDPTCALQAGRCLLDAGAYRPALELLKPAAEAHPEDGRLVRTLALAYLGLGNVPWALKRLLAHLERVPGDAETRAWTAWLMLGEGDLERAQALLDAGPAASGADAARLALIAAAAADLRGDRDAADDALRGVLQGQAALYPEDDALLRHLRQRVRGDDGRPLSVRAHLTAGYTSNAVQSAPTDPGAGAAGDAGTGSPLLGADVVVRLEPWASRWVRPLGELRVKGTLPFAPATLDFSYLDLGGRAGVEIGADGPRLRVAYAAELMAVHGGDVYRDPGPRWFSEAHRAELEFAPVPAVQLFGGVGRRVYRELPRTRTEVDGGAALVVALPHGFHLTGIATGRYQHARHEAYEDAGATGLVRFVVPLPRGAMIKLKGMVVWDHYPRSAAYYGTDEARNDLLGKLQAGPWLPPLGPLRVGVSYTFSGRHSTVERYAYLDHRVLLEVRLDVAGDPAAPRHADPGAGHLPLPYGLDEGRGDGLDRVQDLLRQEDSARRGSSCVD